MSPWISKLYCSARSIHFEYPCLTTGQGIGVISRWREKGYYLDRLFRVFVDGTSQGWTLQSEQTIHPCFPTNTHLVRPSLHLELCEVIAQQYLNYIKSLVILTKEFCLLHYSIFHLRSAHGVAILISSPPRGLCIRGHTKRHASSSLRMKRRKRPSVMRSWDDGF